VNIVNIAELKNFKEKNNNENEFSKQQINNTIKQINFQLESNEKKNKEVINQNFKKIEDDLKEELASFVNSVENVKIENGKYHREAMNKVNEMKNESESIKLLKQEINEMYNKEVERTKKLQSVNYEGIFKDIEQAKIQINNLNSITKVNSNKLT